MFSIIQGKPLYQSKNILSILASNMECNCDDTRSYIVPVLLRNVLGDLGSMPGIFISDSEKRPDATRIVFLVYFESGLLQDWRGTPI